MYDYGSVAMAGDKIITKRHSISAADEIYTLTPADGQVAQLSHENDHIFKQLNLGKVEERWTKTTDGKQMLSWVIYPVNFDANKKYPTLLFCEGGRKVPSANSGATAGTSRLWQPTIILSSLRIVVGYLDSAWNGWNKLAVTMEVNV